MNQEKIYLAGGCFWGTEKYLQSLTGVLSTSVGYALGKKENYNKPLADHVSYEEVCNHSGHAEAVEVIFDPQVLSLFTLLQEFSYTIDPTSLGRQGMDVGIQYRTGVYFVTEHQEAIIARFLAELQKEYDRPVVVENLPLLQYIPAEDNHQKYLDKHPTGYCHINFGAIAKKKQKIVDPNLYPKQPKARLQEILTPLQFAVTQENATEPPFQNDYWQTEAEGLYVDITTGEPLFTSKDKFQSNCGWPSFSKPLDPNAVTEYDDLSFDMIRTEVRSRCGNAHLGHIFPDGPAAQGGLRYCINSASLGFIAKEDMEKEGYGAFLPFL